MVAKGMEVVEAQQQPRDKVNAKKLICSCTCEMPALFPEFRKNNYNQVKLSVRS